MPGKKKLLRHDASKVIGVKTDAERIIEYLQHDTETINERLKLPEYLQVKLDRILTAKALLLKHKFPNKVQNMLISIYGYSEASAWRDMRLVDQVFGSLMRVNKDMRRAIAESMIEQDRALCIEQKDTKGANMATANYIKLFQLDKTDAELPDLSHFEFHQNIIAVLPEQVGLDNVSEDELLDKVDEWIIDVDFEESDDV